MCVFLRTAVCASGQGPGRSLRGLSAVRRRRESTDAHGLPQGVGFQAALLVGGAHLLCRRANPSSGRPDAPGQGRRSQRGYRCHPGRANQRLSMRSREPPSPRRREARETTKSQDCAQKPKIVWLTSERAVATGLDGMAPRVRGLPSQWDPRRFRIIRSR